MRPEICSLLFKKIFFHLIAIFIILSPVQAGNTLGGFAIVGEDESDEDEVEGQAETRTAESYESMFQREDFDAEMLVKRLATTFQRKIDSAPVCALFIMPEEATEKSWLAQYGSALSLMNLPRAERPAFTYCLLRIITSDMSAEERIQLGHALKEAREEDRHEVVTQALRIFEENEMCYLDVREKCGIIRNLAAVGGRAAANLAETTLAITNQDDITVLMQSLVNARKSFKGSLNAACEELASKIDPFSIQTIMAALRTVDAIQRREVTLCLKVCIMKQKKWFAETEAIFAESVRSEDLAEFEKCLRRVKTEDMYLDDYAAIVKSLARTDPAKRKIISRGTRALISKFSDHDGRRSVGIYHIINELSLLPLEYINSMVKHVLKILEETSLTGYSSSYMIQSIAQAPQEEWSGGVGSFIQLLSKDMDWVQCLLVAKLFFCCPEVERQAVQQQAKMLITEGMGGEKQTGVIQALLKTQSALRLAAPELFKQGVSKEQILAAFVRR